MFNPQIFDTTHLQHTVLVFDDNGTIELGPYETDPGLTPALFLPWLDQILTFGGYDYTYGDLAVDYAGATIHYGLYSVTNPAPNVWKYDLDNGILGTSGVDIIVDGEGDNIIDAGAGNDLVLVGYGNDAVAGGDGHDLIFTDAGDDIVDGGRGNDRIFLYDGNDMATGGSGADELYGENGDDDLWGGQGHDLLDGGDGNDELFGEAGRDTLLGGDGNDNLSGGGGADRLNGGTGIDMMTGGAGADTFVFNFSDGNDTITDFDPVRDMIELDLALGVSSFADLQQIGTEVGGDLVLDFGNGDVLILEDTGWADLTAGDFVFI